MANNSNSTTSSYTSNNIPSGSKSVSTGGKPFPMKLVIISFIGFIGFLILMYYIFSPSQTNSNEQKPTISNKNQSIEANNSSNSASSGRKISSSPQGNSNVATTSTSATSNSPTMFPQSSSGQTENQIFFTDEQTGKRYVITPKGNFAVDSQEGREFIAAYNQNNQNNQNAQNAQNLQQGATTVSKDELDQIQKTSQNQIKELDEKINAVSAELDSVKKQNALQKEALQKVASKVISIQPIVKSPTELAKALFGKNGDKVLNSKNQEISAVSVVGNKAYLTNSNGDYYLVEVGDVVEGTSLKVKAINADTNTVLVAY